MAGIENVVGVHPRVVANIYEAAVDLRKMSQDPRISQEIRGSAYINYRGLRSIMDRWIETGKINRTDCPTEIR